MTGPELSDALTALAGLVRRRETVGTDELAALLELGLGVSFADSEPTKGNAARCRRYRRSRKHVAPHVEHVGERPPDKPPPVSRPMSSDMPKHVETMSADMSPTPALSPTPPLSSPEKPAAAAADSDPKPREASVSDTMSRDMPPRNLAEALAIEAVCVRAGYVVAAEVDAGWVQPEKWPEVLAIEAELAKAESRAPQPLLPYHRDAGVRAVVALFAGGYQPGMLKDAVRRAVASPWWTQGKPKGLSTLSVEVVRRALKSGDTVDERAERLRKATEEREAKQLAAQAARGA